jgi:hypothetical protein
MVAIQSLDRIPEMERPALRLIPGGLDTSPVPVAIYRRRRVAACVCALVLVVGAWAAVLAGFRLLVGGPESGSLTAPVATASAAPPPGATVHVVRPGETIWTIAEAITPADQDVRATVDRLVDHNGGATVRPGQRLVLD